MSYLIMFIARSFLLMAAGVSFGVAVSFLVLQKEANPVAMSIILYLLLSDYFLSQMNKLPKLNPPRPSKSMLENEQKEKMVSLINKIEEDNA